MIVTYSVERKVKVKLFETAVTICMMIPFPPCEDDRFKDTAYAVNG